MKFTSCRVSVIIPTHNRGRLLERALLSVEAQTSPPWEVIVIDDGSTDDTRRRIAARFPSVRYLTQPQAGVSSARNRGIAQARGDWLAFLDSDDEWHGEKLEKQLQALCDRPGHLLCHTDEVWIRHGRRVNPKRRHKKYGGWIFSRCLPLCAISPSSVLVHRGVLESVGGFDESLPACEDYDLWLRVTARYPVLLVDQALVTKYGGHADQLSRRFWGMDRFRIQALEKVLTQVDLGSENQREALTVLVSKLDVYLKGAVKREKWQEVEIYRHKRSLYQELLTESLTRCRGDRPVPPSPPERDSRDCHSIRKELTLLS